MLFQNVLRVCFLALLAPKIETNAQLNSDTEKPEGLFADVIKNITRVNIELQDLINNYEQLKKTQNSVENLEDSESDAVGGRVNRNSKTFVGNQRDTSGKTLTTLKHQTEMIYVEEAGKSSEPETSIESEKSSKSQLSKEVEKSSEVNPGKPMEKTDKYKIKVQKTTTKARIVNEGPIAPKEETEPENHKFVNIKNTKIIPDGKVRIIPEAAVQQTSKNTKYSEKETQTIYLSHNSSESDSSVDMERRTEDEAVGVNKPKERAYEKVNNDIQVTAGIYFRSQNNRTNLKTTIIKKVDNGTSLEFTDNDEGLSKDLFKTSVLRQAYADVCLKVVIRKCYKACKSAFTFSCQVFKCKTELKMYFDTSSRKRCIDAFNGSSKGDDSYGIRRVVVPEASNGGIMTREGYLSVACQTEIEKPTRRMSNVTAIKNGEQVDILRGIYEKACQKISRKKCGTACQSAQTATCNRFNCSKRLKTNLKKNCKLECKLAYSNKAQKSSDSDADSYDDSDDSDYDSDDDES